MKMIVFYAMLCLLMLSKVGYAMADIESGFVTTGWLKEHMGDKNILYN